VGTRAPPIGQCTVDTDLQANESHEGVTMSQRLTSPRLAALATAAGLALAVAAPSARALTLYDDFSGTAISANKWSGEEHTQYGASIAESRRALSTGSVRIEARGYGDKASNAGTGRVRNQLTFDNSAVVSEIKATVTPRTVSFYNCPANTSASQVRFRLIGGFFNAGTPDAGSYYNDVFAAIQIYRLSNSTDATGVMKVSGVVFQCTDNSCINSTTLGSVDLTGTGAAVNTPTDLHVTWDKTNHQFIFQKDADAPQNVTYTVSDGQRATYYGKRMETTSDIANCTALRANAYGGADFDNVYTNP
jgi:hypothetical protein